MALFSFDDRPVNKDRVESNDPSYTHTLLGDEHLRVPVVIIIIVAHAFKGPD